MNDDWVTRSRKRYERLKKVEKINFEILADIAHGIKDILEGNIREI